MNQIEIHFDGGCRPTNPGNKYGSFEVRLDQKQVCLISRMELGFGTNNEAEFEILIEALKWTVRELFKGGYAPSHYCLEMFTDSTIVEGRLKKQNCGGKGEAAQRMGKLAGQCLAHLTLFKRWSIHWRQRDNNVARFGH
jgi:ribonuclease HI